jgi:hypothetical protein
MTTLKTKLFNFSPFKRTTFILMILMIFRLSDLTAQATVPLCFENNTACDITVCITIYAECEGVPSGIFEERCQTFTPVGTAGSSGCMGPYYTPLPGSPTCITRISKMTVDNGHGVVTILQPTLAAGGSIFLGPGCIESTIYTMSWYGGRWIFI